MADHHPSIDTIFALASAPGRAGVSVYRISGPKSGQIYTALTNSDQLPPARMAKLARLYDPNTDQMIDQAMVLYFNAPDSFTGEDVLECHIHGGLAIQESLEHCLSGMDGVRLAKPGEFSKRAFMNDKLDLTQAESIADLVDAQTARQQAQALAQLRGNLHDLYHSWRQAIIHMMAMIEADLDFSDESDVANLRPTDLPDRIGALRDNIQDHLADDHRGQRIRSGIRVAVIGPPNAGKSSLVNHLAAEELAIVTDQAGTTRDVLRVDLDIAGYPVVLYDTAGLRDKTEDKIEAEGIRRAKQQARQADITLGLFDGQDIPDDRPDYLDSQAIIVFNKMDAGSPVIPDWADDPMMISVTENIGLDNLMDRLSGWIKAAFGQSAHGVSLTRSRHRNALTQAVEALQRAKTAPDPELMAEDLRLGARHIGSITGQVGVDDVLDKIFRDFCIGK